MVLDPSYIYTWVFISDIGVDEEPVIQCYQLEEGEACPAKIPKPVGVHFSIQSSANYGKYI